MVGVFLGLKRARNWDDFTTLDQDLFRRFFHGALRRGVLIPPSPYESWFLMESHLDGTLEEALGSLKLEGGDSGAGPMRMFATLDRKELDRPPIWFMRQTGLYLSEL